MANKKLGITVYEIGDHEPADGSLVVGWSASADHPKVLEYRKKKIGFYDWEMPANPHRFFYLSELIGLAPMQAIRDRRDRQRDLTKRRILAR